MVPKAAKARAGRTDVGATPVTVRSRIPLDRATSDDARLRLARKVGELAPHLERLSVRFEDVNGPRGGIGIVCRITAVLSALPSVVVEARAADPGLALRRAADALARTLRRTLARAERATPRRRSVRADRATTMAAATDGAGTRDDEGSLIGARVGHGRVNLERALDRPEKRRRDAFVDTSLPGVSASDRKAGYGATAARNTKRNTAGMQAALEDSRTTPSRKSTRRASNRMKAATSIARTAQLAARTPRARAARAHARKPPRR